MHPIVKTVAAHVHGGDIDKAEGALVAVADQEGDRALALIIDSLPPRDLVAILREHDASRPSIVTELITPERFVQTIALERQYRDRTHEALRGMINAALFANEARIDDFIVALGADEHGREALVDYFSERHEEVEHFFMHGRFGVFPEGEFDGVGHADDDLDDAALGEYLDEIYEAPNPDDEDAFADLVGDLDDEIRDGDWHELAWRLRCDHYEIFREVLERLRGRRRAVRAELIARAREAAARPLSSIDDEDGDDVL